MGYRLSNEVLDHAPDDLTPAERLVLSVLAGYVVDEATRECYPGLDKLVRRTGLKPDSLRKVFQRLAARGLDPRVSLGVDKKGRSVYAHENVRTTYRIPRFESRDESPATEAGSASPHSEASGGTVVPQRRDDSPSEGGSASRPKDQERTERSLSPHLPQQAIEEPPVTDEREISSDRTNDDTAKVVAAWIAARGGRRNPRAEAKVRSSAASLLAVGRSIPDVIAIAEDMAVNYPTGSDLAIHDDHYAAQHKPGTVRLRPWCGCGGNPAAEFNGKFRTHNGTATGQPCLICHPDALQESA